MFVRLCPGPRASRAMNGQTVRAVEDSGRENEVHHASLVFERDEDDAARRHGTLAREDEPRDFDQRSVAHVQELDALVMTPLFFIRARRCRIGWSVNRETEPRVVEAKLLDRRRGAGATVRLVRKCALEELPFSGARTIHMACRRPVESESSAPASASASI